MYNTPEFIMQLITEKELPFFKGFWANLHLSYRSNQPVLIKNSMVFKDGASLVGKEMTINGFLLANLGLRYQYKILEVEASCYNLFNHQYLLGGDRVPVPQAGRMFLGAFHLYF